MTTIPRALSRATNELHAISDTPRLDAELLMAEALNVDRDRLILAPPGGMYSANIPFARHSQVAPSSVRKGARTARFHLGVFGHCRSNGVGQLTRIPV